MRNLFPKKVGDVDSEPFINNNNLLLGSSITKSGLHRGPSIHYGYSTKIKHSTYQKKK